MDWEWIAAWLLIVASSSIASFCIGYQLGALSCLGCGRRRCADCGKPVGMDKDGPPDGWQLEDGRTVCNRCCSSDLKRLAKKAKA